MIHTEDLTKHFDDFVAVDGVNLDVSTGDILVLLGPNGAGKTTTVRMLTSILIPTRGSATVAGYDVAKQPDKVRSSVGVLTEHHGLYGRMTALEYLEFYGDLYGMKKQACRKRIDILLDRFGLADARKKRLGEYSKGMRQKLSLTRALLHEPPVLLLDEPTSAMDPESARMVRDAILLLQSSDRTIVLCTHNLTEAEELADQIAIIWHGKILHCDTPANLKRQLLGPVRFEARLRNNLDHQPVIDLPPGVQLVSNSGNQIQFQIQDAEMSNPILLSKILEAGLEVISFHEIPQSLEQAYLVAVAQAANDKGNKDAMAG